MTAALICDDCDALMRTPRLPAGWANYWPQGDDAMRHRCPACLNENAPQSPKTAPQRLRKRSGGAGQGSAETGRQEGLW